MSLLSAALNIHLNVGQNQTINTSSVFMSFQTVSSRSLSERSIEGGGNTRVDLPSNLSLTIADDQTMSLRVGLSFFFFLNTDHVFSLHVVDD